MGSREPELQMGTEGEQKKTHTPTHKEREEGGDSEKALETVA
jgi:hypothetical protein